MSFVRQGKLEEFLITVRAVVFRMCVRALLVLIIGLFAQIVERDFVVAIWRHGARSPKVLFHNRISTVYLDA